MKVSEVINWNDISTHKVTAIYAGVGSGKSTLINKIITEGIKGQTEVKKVLLLTSRKAKVDETIPELEDVVSGFIGLKGNIKLSKYDWWEYNYGLGGLAKRYLHYEVDKDKKILNRSVVCTYAKIEPVLRKIYKNDLDLLYDYNSIIWEWFDLIVVDEVHSLLMDAGYQSAPFHIYNMIKAFNDRCTDPDKHLILMTGTPQPVDKILHDICSDINVIDLFDKCVNITPKEVRFIAKEDVQRDIADKIKDNKKVIYFYNGSFVTSKDFCKGIEIDESVVATTFTNTDVRDWYKENDESGFARMVYTEDVLAKLRKLPDMIQLLLTTSRLKEGINIVDDIDYVYVDTHLPADVIQMSGRVRSGNHVLYIVVDAYQFDNEEDVINEKIEIENNKIEVYDFNKHIKDIEDTSEKLDYIDSITKEWITESESDETKKQNLSYRPYVIFNYFTNNFEFYTLKECYYNYKLYSIEEWNNCDANKPKSYQKLVSSWFPETVNINTYESKIYKSLRLFKNKYRFQIDSKFEKDRYKKDRIDKFIKDLQEVWNKENVQLAYYLKLFLPDISVKKCGKNKKLYCFVTKKE